MLAKITGNKMILGAVVGIVGGLIVAVMLVVVMGVGRSSPPVEAAADPKTGAKAAAPAAAGKATPKTGAKAATEAKFGPTYIIKDRIVNLADPGGRRYLRFSVAIEFEPHAEAASAPIERSTGGNQLVLYVPEDDDAAYQPVTGGGA